MGARVGGGVLIAACLIACEPPGAYGAEESRVCAITRPASLDSSQSGGLSVKHLSAEVPSHKVSTRAIADPRSSAERLGLSFPPGALSTALALR